jgi:heme oxygenase
MSRRSSALTVTVHSSLSRQLTATAEAVSRPLYSKAAETAVTVAVAVAVVLESSTLCAVLLWLTAGSSGEGTHVGADSSTAGVTVQ